MNRKTLIYFAMTLVMAAYCIMSLTLSGQAADTAMCLDPVVNVNDTLTRRFVTADEVRNILRRNNILIDSVTWKCIDTRRIEQVLMAETNIESARCTRMSDDRLVIAVTPMLPVIRVFETGGSPHGYYVNREGKRLVANATYHVDVPVVTGTFSHDRQPTYVIPVAEHISRDSVLNALITCIQLKPNGDIMLIPSIRGQVINFGDTALIDDKFARLRTMYRRVMPAKGWEFYDTLSVKFAGQVVATRRIKRLPDPLIRFDQPGDSIEEPDISIMLTDSPNTTGTDDSTPGGRSRDNASNHAKQPD